MRLKTIRLAGFKSFVDPTVLHLPSNLIGVVGPNGCGKSNIIDAVRWVMGESSARLLRGDSMSDVIFNGSSARKPVGAASVELLFDNSDGSAGGEYARYAEISVKRQVSRDGQSVYLLNGARCRRRDITDIFLGTGLGPRSYSIIEQGMISRIVEARPEEIRSYLEEAAGISKYKERRRDTENRIRHTRENLARLEDLRSEVSKHIERLQRQARQAERYKALKAEHDQRQAELWALQWRDLDRDLLARRGRLRELELALEQAVAGLRSVEAETEATRAGHEAALERVNAVQAELYEKGAEIARLEQGIQHRRELQSSQRRQQAEAEQQWQDLVAHVDLDQAHLEALRGEIAAAEPELASARSLEEETSARTASLAEAVQAWQQEWDAFAERRAAAERATEVERTRIAALDRSLDERTRRLEALRQERGELSPAELESALGGLVTERDGARGEQQRLEEQAAALREEATAAQQRNRALAEELNTLRERHQALGGRLSSLEALQQAALGEDAEAVQAWLRARGLEAAPRLAQAMEVDAGFEGAVEGALGPFLEAVVVPDPWALLEDGPPPPGLILVSGAAAPDGGRRGLAAHVEGPAVLAELLADVAVVEGLPELAAGAGTLAPGARLAAGDGACAGRLWLRTAVDAETAGILTREKEIGELREEQVQVARRGSEIRGRLEAGEAEAVRLETEREKQQQALGLHLRRVAEIEGQIQSRQARLDGLRDRAAKVDRECEALEQELGSDREELGKARARLQQEVDRMAALEQERTGLEERRGRLFEDRDEAQRAARVARDQAQELAISLESRRSALRSTEQALARTTQQISQLDERRRTLGAEADRTGAPLEEEERRLATLLEERLEVEARLREARKAAEEQAEAARRLDRRRHELDAGIAQHREAVEAARLENEGVRVKAENLAERLAQVDARREALLEALEEDAEAEAWEAELERLEQRIRRLEPVNLAAIQEFEEEQERKRYLDEQNDDLVAALETLEGAIRKIDRETRTRFKETFDRVNAGVQKLFPRLFGGGHGFLELVGDDLLEAGVAIMARPPGKRISNIHLLSGGEKALTAVSFVFAIFQLNPAPFCMLDEVDAPLDDANVGRFSDMVREMSEQVQFVVVTHNKITMGIAHQLMGVTMHEPGVSRMVTVDIGEAERMAASS